MAKSITLFELLKDDHQDVKRQLENLIAICKSNTEIDPTPLEKARGALELHMKLEEQLFYPEAQKVGEVREMITHAYEEHKDLRERVKGIDRKLAVDKIRVALEEILQKLEDHVRDEEDEVFPKLERVWEEDFLFELGERAYLMKEKEMAR